MMLEVYRKHQGVPVLRLDIVWICMQVARLGPVPCVQNINVLPAVIHGRAHPASVQPLPLAKTARTLTIPTIAKYAFKHLHTQAFLGKKILKSGCTIRCRSRVLRQPSGQGMHSPMINVLLVAHEAKEIAHVVIYPSLAEAVAAAAHERIFIIKGSHGV
jgi:hypothetical protein